MNLAWPVGGMGDGDYLHAVTRLLLPIAYDFSPDLILVGPGFDAALGTQPSQILETNPLRFCYAHDLRISDSFFYDFPFTCARSPYIAALTRSFAWL